MQFDRAKLNALILYACEKCDPSNLGAVKLHKVLYFSDMFFYAEYGRPITGATYRKRPFGPTCDSLLESLSELAQNGKIDIKTVDYFGYQKKEFHPMGKPDLWRFSKDESELIDEVINFVCINNSAKTISEFSHNRAWDLAEFGEVLPYSSIFQIFPTQVSLEALAWAEGEAEKIEVARSEANSVDFVTFADFRSRVLAARGEQ